jgi:hypothetical protein
MKIGVLGSTVNGTPAPFSPLDPERASRLGGHLRMRARTPCLCLLLAVVSACGGSHNPVSNPATAPYVPWTGSIAFRSGRDGKAELYRANPDSANPMRLTSNAPSFRQ